MEEIHGYSVTKDDKHVILTFSNFYGEAESVAFEAHTWAEIIESLQLVMKQ